LFWQLEVGLFWNCDFLAASTFVCFASSFWWVPIKPPWSSFIVIHIYSVGFDIGLVYVVFDNGGGVGRDQHPYLSFTLFSGGVGGEYLRDLAQFFYGGGALNECV
jgi:hypothetical protein